MMKSRRMSWEGYVTRMGRRGIHIEYLWESQKERDHWENRGAGGWPILTWILKK
jgi:hypothetical protein